MCSARGNRAAARRAFPIRDSIPGAFQKRKTPETIFIFRPRRRLIAVGLAHGGLAMQPATNPEDIRSILNRFEAWSVKQPGSDNVHLHAARDDVREITYDEAIRKFQRQRGAGRTVGSSNSRAEMDSGSSAGELNSGTPLCEGAQLDNNPRTAMTKSVDAEALKQNSAGSATPAMRASVATAEDVQTRSKRKRKSVAKKNSLRPGARQAPQTSYKSRVAAAGQGVRQSSIESPPRGEARTAGRRNVTEPAFGAVLARSLRQSPGKMKRVERSARISIRFSATEEQQLRHAAFEAGLTVSAYLRNRALAANPLRTIGTGTEMTADLRVHEPRSTAALGVGKRIARKIGEYLGWGLTVSERV